MTGVQTCALPILKTFKATNYESFTVKTVGELDKVFKDKKFAVNDKIRLVEIKLDTLDAPENLVKQAERSASTNK